MKKILIVDLAGWGSVGDKAQVLRMFFLPVADIQFTCISYRYEIEMDASQYEGMYMPRLATLKWIASEYPAYDDYLFIVDPKVWGENQAKGWIVEGKYMSVSCGEHSKIYFDEPISEFFWLAAHEISHNLCQEAGVEDKTHFYFDFLNPNHMGIISYLWEEKKSSALNELLKALIRILTGYKNLLTNQLEVLTTENMPKEPSKDPLENKLNALANAMARVETGNFNPKTLPMRLNNPLALKYVGQRGAVRSTNGFCKFPTYAEGLTAGLNQLRIVADGTSKAYNAEAKKRGLKNCSKLTIVQFLHIWASSSPKIEKDNYVIAVCSEVGIKPDTQMTYFVL